MKTVLHISTTDARFWRKSADGWLPCEDPGTGPLWVVCNLPEETFAEIQVPRIFGRDRQNFIHRQLVSRFPDTPYRTVLAQAGSGGLMDRLAPPLRTVFGVDAAERIHTVLDRVASFPVAGVWATSMLLAQLGSHAAMPSEMFVVLPGVDGLRVVFVKNRVPVLSRLIPGVKQAADVATEITRTVRYLENNHALDRSANARQVFFLGTTSEVEPWLALERLALVAPPPGWRSAPPADWQFALFDLAIRSPNGQLAPMARRTRFVASQLRRPALAGVGLSVGLSIWAATAGINDMASAYANGEQSRQHIAELTAQTQRLDGKIAGFGVSSEAVRQAIALEQREIVEAPSLAGHLQQLSGIVNEFDPARMRQLDWLILDPGQAACSLNAATPNSAAAPVADEPQQLVQVRIEVLWPAAQTDRARLQGVSHFSAKIVQLEGAKLLADPALALKLGRLSGGGTPPEKTDAGALTWCLTLPGSMGAKAAKS
jgi:hypothetical protein